MAFFSSAPKWAKAGFLNVKSFICSSLFLYHYIKQIDSMLPCVCSVIDYRKRQNVCKNISDYLPHFDVICDVLLNRRTATLNLFVK